MRMNRKTFREYIESAEEGKEYAVSVVGGSMFPFLLNKISVVYLEKPKQDEYTPKKGDIVFFRRKNGAYVLHRIYKVKKDGILIINGDAQNWFEQTDKSAVCGVVEKIQRKNKIFSVKNPVYRLLVFIWQSVLPLRPLIFKIIRSGG